MGVILSSYFADNSSDSPHHLFSHMSTGQKALLGVSGLAVALAAAPFVLPAFGVGELEQITALTTCTTGAPTGLAGQSAVLLGQLPLVGETLSHGGIWNGVGAGAIAIAGTLAANRMEEASENKSLFSWHGLVRAATIATSALVAAPALLQSLTMGVHYFSLLAGTNIYGDPNQFRDVIMFAQENIGKLGAQGAAASTSALSASSALLPHILSCGVAAGVGGAALHGSAHHAVAHSEPGTRIDSFTAQVEKFKQALAMPKQSMADHVMASRAHAHTASRMA
jgi:hypothetical protein